MKASGPVFAVSVLSSDVWEHQISKLLSCMCDILVGILYTDIYIYIYIYTQIYIYIYIYIYTGCPRRNVPDFGRVFLMLKYTDISV